MPEMRPRVSDKHVADDVSQSRLWLVQRSRAGALLSEHELSRRGDYLLDAQLD